MSELPEGPPPSGVSSTDILGRANSVIYACNTIRAQIKTWQERKEQRNTFMVTINSSDRFFFQLQTWLLKQIKIDNLRSLRALSTSNGPLKYLFDDSTAQWITVDGHRIQVSSEKPKDTMENLRAELTGTADGNGIVEPRLVFIAKSLEGFEAVKRKLEEVRKEAQANLTDPPRLHYSTGFYSDSSTALRERPVDSVVLAEGQMERIIEDLDLFLNSEKTYVERGVPYQRGYLFYGPPGTGKTSLAKVLANHFHLDIYYIALGSVSGDTELMRAISRTNEKSIVLFEDIDVFNGVKDREEADSDRGFTLSGFLNILDGMLTPHGVIKIMTTNHREVIDSAVIRAGRIDVAEELGLLHGKQSDRMFFSFYKTSPSSPLMIENVAPAAIMEVLKTHMFDPDAAEAEIRERFL